MKKVGRNVALKSKNPYGLRLVHADVTIRSASGKSIRDKDAVIDAKTVRDYYPPEGFVKLAEEILREMGVQIVAKNRITICIAAPLEEFERIFGVTLTKKRFFPYVVPKRQRTPDKEGCGIELFYKGGKKLPLPNKLCGLVESVHLATPAKFCAPPNADPPTPGYFHLKVPGDVSRLVDANQCHNHGFNGNGTVLAMPDQGTFDHPYYTARGYDITLDETAYDDTADDGSHGTAIAANALAVAPGVKFIGVRNGKKISSGTAAFQTAASYNPDVISVSWGTDNSGADVADLRAAIAQAVANGITVCCACGNGGPVVFPSSMPDVISVGGAFADENDGLQAATYASSGIFGTDPGRQMPDLTGFVGQSPNGIYITLPCHPDSSEDKHFGGGIFPTGDETATDDGWLVASGTSSATPQVAAAACLLIESDPALKGQPALIKQRLMETALDVATGNSASSDAATVGTDNATGTGVVDAFLAINRVDVWLRDNENDRGLVPTKGPHWISPDIKVLAAPLADPDADIDGAMHIDRPEYNTTYYVYIKARNRGIDPANNVTASFFYADPSTFISYPEDWKNGQSSDPVQGSIKVEGVAINQFLLDSIPAKGSRVAGPYEWKPPAPAAATQTETMSDGRIRGHFCLLTRLECAADPIIYGSGEQATVWLDNNIGMKNLWVVEAEMSWPLLIGKVPKKLAKYSRLKVEILDPRQGAMLEIRIPKRMLLPDSLIKSEIKYRESRTQKGILYLQFRGERREWEFKVLAEENIPLLCRIVGPKKGDGVKSKITSISKKPQLAKINIQQFAGLKSLGGASVQVIY